MILRFLAYAAVLSVLAAAPAAGRSPSPAAPAQGPNVLLIVADDLGFSDLGAFGGEISTPNLDRLASRGLRLTGFHAAATCSPTRAMLLSGTDNHLAGLGSMAEIMAPAQQGKPGYEGYLRPDIATLAEIMADGGYRTVFSGKWHLGLNREQDPHARGFQHTFALLQGGHDHFGDGLATTPENGDVYTENGRVVRRLPANFYSSDSFTDKLLAHLALSRVGSGAKKPFFAYLAFTAPHWPLQAPDDVIDKYKGRYDSGFEVLRANRLRRQVELGLLRPGVAAHELTSIAGRWNKLSDNEKRIASRNMEIYAAMVDRMDQNVGRVIAALTQSGELDKTIIFFMSDNGAEGNSPPNRDRTLALADNSLGNLGRPKSYVSYGPGWAEAATAPSWLFKGYLTEGGTRVPAFIVAPRLKARGAIEPQFTSVMDVLPTLVQLGGLKLPRGRFAGREVQPVRGKSWAPLVAQSKARIYRPTDAVGGELFGGRALWQGNWKITDIGDGKWRLFDLASDPAETHDLSAQDPVRLKAMIERWDAYRRETGVVMRPSALLPLPK